MTVRMIIAAGALLASTSAWAQAGAQAAPGASKSPPAVSRPRREVVARSMSVPVAWRSDRPQALVRRTEQAAQPASIDGPDVLQGLSEGA